MYRQEANINETNLDLIYVSFTKKQNKKAEGVQGKALQWLAHLLVASTEHATALRNRWEPAKALAAMP